MIIKPVPTIKEMTRNEILMLRSALLQKSVVCAIIATTVNKASTFKMVVIISDAEYHTVVVLLNLINLAILRIHGGNKW